jgi:Protein of unknown function (DUF1570)
MTTPRTIALAFLVILASLAVPVRADILHPTEGGEIVAPVRREGADLVLETPMGVYRFPRRDFRDVIPTLDPAREWPDRRAKALAGGAPERTAAALWALDYGLVAECEAMIREAHSADATHQPAARMVGVADRLKSPLDDPPLPSLTRGLPADRRLARGPHVLLMHQHEQADADERVALLENVVTAYYLYFAALGLDLATPTHRVPSMWFARKDDYLAFLRAEGAVTFLNTRGYHHSTRGLVVAFDCRDESVRTKSRDAILAGRAELDRFAAQIDRIPVKGRASVRLRGEPRSLDRAGAKDLAATLRRQLDIQEVALELSRRELDWAIAAHETVHQLVALSKLAPGHDAFPNALHEGLAMQFESIVGGRWGGLGRPSMIRVRDYRKLEAPPRLEPTIRDTGFGSGYSAEAYARAWASVFYLRSERPTAFVALLDGLRAPADSHRAPGERAGEILHGLIKSDEDDRWRVWMKKVLSEAEPKAGGVHPH